MRRLLTLMFIAAFAIASSAQTAAPKAPAKTAAKKAAPAAKPSPPAADPVAIIHTTVGDLTCKLFPKDAPKTVDNFIGLATGRKQWTDPKKGVIVKGKPLYDGVLFHRVIPNFMVQTGDPLGNGTGGPGYYLPAEIAVRFDRPGRMGMAKSSLGISGSQFFITEVPTPWLDSDFTVFGQCDDASVELVKQIARVATDPRNNRPDQDIKINHITIMGASGVAKKPAVAPKPAAKKPAATTKAPAKPSPTKK